MLLRRFGSKLSSVTPRFNARALTEISFGRTDDHSIEAAELDADWERREMRELVVEAEGDVQDEAEQALLDRLRASLEALEAEVGPDELLVIENESGRDYPKTRDRKRPVIVDGENRLRFEWRIEPPLKIGIYRKNA